MRHTPVMCGEVLEFLAVRPDGVYADLTTGLGGHAEAVARLLCGGTLLALDRDGESLEQARQRLEPFGERIVFRQALFSELEAVLGSLGFTGLDGLVADLGVSYAQLTHPERGFSFQGEAPLDMRMDRTSGPTAADFVNNLAEEDLADLLYQLGEERRARRVSRAIVRARPIRSTAHLARVVEEAVPRAGFRLHPATRVFMALRIAVNRELEELDALLDALPRVLAPGARAVLLTFHSGEDRRVKLAFRQLAQQGRATLLTKRVVRPTELETRENPPSRGAKLRALVMNWQAKRENGDADEYR